MKSNGICTALIASLLAASALNAQEPVARAGTLVGPLAGAALGSLSARVPVYPGGDCGGDFGGGSAFVLKGGVAAIRSGFLSERLGIQLNLSGTLQRARLAVAPLNATHIYDGDARRVIALEREFRLDADEWEVSLDAMLRYEASRQIWIALGPSIGYRAGGTIEQSDNILGPEGYGFPDGLRSHSMTPTVEPAGARLGLVASAGTMLPVGADLYLAPSLSLGADILSRGADAPIRSMRGGVDLALLFDLTPPPDTIPLPVPEQPAPPRLAALLELVGVAPDGSEIANPVVSVREVLVRQHTPLVPAVFFDPSADLIPTRYRRLDPSGTGGFTTDRLSGLDPLEVQHHLLNIIGERMRDRPELSLLLYGSSSTEEPEEIRAARRAVVRGYLTDVWSIDPSRVGVGAGSGPIERSSQATDDGRADNRRVEMVGSDPSLLAPVVTARIVREFDPPELKLTPRITADAGVKEWRIVIRQSGAELARYTSDVGSSGADPTWSIVHDRIDSLLEPVVAELEVVDSAGNATTARAEVPLLLEKKSRQVDSRIEQNGARERMSYVLVAFEFNSPELGEQNENQIAEIASAIGAGAQIRIVGYTDRIGNERRNRDLSRERAERVGAALERRLAERSITGTEMTIEGAGSEVSRFENDLPEGRFLSRGVSVVIEQGVEK
jgi:outer membrane protein OmpA-like peptidoglycan-associated protein